MSHITFKAGPVAQNRTEELGYDLWDTFVIPPYFHTLDINSTRKPKVIIGGRGCGKTMLLRYLSHNTQFSKKRSVIKENEIAHIGLYWRVDTQFASLMNKRGLDEQEWNNCFEHLTVLVTSIEIIKSIESVATSSYESIDSSLLSRISLRNLISYDASFPNNIVECFSHLKKQLAYFQSWLNNIKKISEPIFYPKSFIDALIKELQAQVPQLNSTTFFVYIDEYENLIGYQKRLVNTWLKHSEPPLVFNLAMKENSFDEKNTIGNEQISDIHDYRTYGIEEYLRENEAFETFAAEIFLLKLSLQGVRGIPIEVNKLHDPVFISERQAPSYKERLRGIIEKIFPSTSRDDLVSEIFAEDNLLKRLKEDISEALTRKNSKYTSDDFVNASYKEASLINTCLIYREKPGIESVLKEFKKLQAGVENNYTGKTDWINNNFYGSYLLFHEPLNRPCKFYSGYSTFCQLSKGNIRYVLELCYKSLIRREDQINSTDYLENLVVDPSTQAEAARQASKAFLEEVKTYGRLGNHLYTFVLRLGNLFHHAHKRLTQSEPEQNHFAIEKVEITDAAALTSFLTEALKWSILFIEKSTKDKSESSTEFNEYILNPIYSPYFHISYRKKRKITLSRREFQTLAEGSADQYNILLRSFLKKWELDEEATGSLFPDL
jgi:hypothetical protein